MYMDCVWIIYYNCMYMDCEWIINYNCMYMDCLWIVYGLYTMIECIVYVDSMNFYKRNFVLFVQYNFMYENCLIPFICDSLKL